MIVEVYWFRPLTSDQFIEEKKRFIFLLILLSSYHFYQIIEAKLMADVKKTVYRNVRVVVLSGFQLSQWCPLAPKEADALLTPN